MKPLSLKLYSDEEAMVNRKLREQGNKDATKRLWLCSRGLGGDMKKVIAIIFLIPALVLIGTVEATTRDSFTLANLISVESASLPFDTHQNIEVCER